MNRFIYFAPACVALFTLASCADWNEDHSQFDLPVEVSMQNYAELRPKLSIIPVETPRDMGVKQLQITLDMSNHTDNDLKLEYKLWFVDARGATVEQATEWHHLTFKPHEAKGLWIQSISVAAKDFRIEFRERH